MTLSSLHKLLPFPTNKKAMVIPLEGRTCFFQYRTHGFRYKSNGKENILVKGEGVTLENVRIIINGNGNKITIHENAAFKTMELQIRGEGNHIEIGRECRLKGQITVKGKRQTVTIGDHTTAVEIYILCMEQKHVHIGERCMISRNVEIRTSDAHSVMSLHNGRRINLAANVVIEDKVWLGARCFISKGAYIPEGSVVGAGSIVTGAFKQKNIMLAGIPAGIIKENICWDRRRISIIPPDPKRKLA